MVEDLEKTAERMFIWFAENGMKANEAKSHLLSSLPLDTKAVIGDTYIENSDQQKLLGIKIDRKLKFDLHVTDLCQKTSQKLHALARVAPYMDTQKRRVIMKAFVTSQFSYCPLIWMFHNRTLNNRINNLHVRALRIIYCDHTSTFKELLHRDKSKTIHEKNLETLAIEIYKAKNKLSPDIISDIFLFRSSTYNLRNERELCYRTAKTSTYGTETISNFAPKLWQMIPSNIKTSETLQEFKSKIKKWNPESCPCRLCKPYINGLGFI